MDIKKIFTFCFPLLDSLSKGSLIRKATALLFGLIGTLIFVEGIYYFFKAISYAPDFWAVIFLLLFLIFSFISLQIWFYRAKAILSLEESQFTVIPIISNLFRAFGENYAVFLVILGIGGALNLWFSKYIAYVGEFTRYIPFVEDISDTFIGGFLFLLLTIIIAFFMLLLMYFVAESVLVLVEIAKNTNSLRKVNQEEIIKS